MALPARDHRISLDAATVMTRQFRTRSAGAQKAGAFHGDQVQGLLAQKGCVALRIYNGVNDKGENVFVLVGMDANDKDMTGGTILQVSFPCPPFCDDGSSLNA